MNWGKIGLISSEVSSIIAIIVGIFFLLAGLIDICKYWRMMRNKKLRPFINSCILVILGIATIMVGVLSLCFVCYYPRP